MTSRTAVRRRGALVVALALAAGACETEVVTQEPASTVAAIAGSDDCTQAALSGDDPEFVFSSAYRVVDGRLGGRCLGEDDPTILDAWEALSTIAPATQLSDLALFAGFEPDGEVAAETLAFVNALDADGAQFQMSVNTVEAEVDPDELLLTLAHEFSHVFAGTAEQLDRTDEAIDACSTYFNGEGCYLPDSLMLAWIDAFWDDALLASVDPFEDSPEDADARCATEDGFFGPYAATNPEEDFAEAFSAFVFGLEPDTDGQAARLDWIAGQRGLAEFRDRADSAGMTPLANNFETCGR
ncbi:MAG TPA: hypothetical protein VK860_04020 [Ilumatobacteraceae bacterium]|nr:hypothetical protein [Ilumatobacteraceae bacterium]